VNRRFEQYYASELSYLRDLGRAFAQAHPAIAGFLSERGADPDVERLLEGFAFLTARVHQRIDDAIPELVEPLLDALLPHYLRPIPASTIVQFSAQRGATRGRVQIPRGAALGSRNVDGVSCSFRTCQDVELLPISLLDQRLEDATTTQPTLTLRFDMTKGGGGAVFHERGLRLHLHGELAIASHMQLWLLRHLRSIEVVTHGATPAAVTLPPARLVSVGHAPEDALLPWPRTSPDGTRLLVEWLTLPSRFLFVDVGGLDAVQARECERFDLRFHFDRPPPLPTRLPEDLFRLHCAPAVNLFETTAEPIRGDGTARPGTLRASGLRADHAEVYSVESVNGIVARSGLRKTYLPYHGLGRLAPGATAEGHYVLARSISPIDDGVDVAVSIGEPRNALALLEEETLSIEMTCTNRSLPAELRVGDVNQPVGATPAGVRFANIGTVTRPARPPLGSELEWRLLAHVSTARGSLLDRETLRAHFELHNLHRTVDRVLGEANARRIEAIAAIHTEPVVRVVRGGPIRGIAVTIDLDETAFGSLGEAFLFGSVLDRLLGERAPVHSFTATALRLLSTNSRLTWEPRNGARAIF
jgi:type VI secretion system protein ImpG